MTGDPDPLALKGVPVGVVPAAPTGTLLPKVLVAIMGPYPMKYGADGRTTLDDTLEMCETIGAVPVFIPDLITKEEKEQAALGVSGIRLRGHTAMRNMGVKMALKGGYDYLFLVENDAKVQKDTLVRLLEHGKDVILPHLVYPSFPVVEMICFGPQPRPDHERLLKLIWSAHSATLFDCRALKKVRKSVFRGYHEEGKDYMYWRKQGLDPYMDLDTPVEVLEVAAGHRQFLEIPFRAHYNHKGKACSGPVYEYRRSKNVAIYRCRAEDCDYELFFEPPHKGPSPRLSHPLVDPVVRAYGVMEKDYWADRAVTFPNLQWARDTTYLRLVLEAGKVRRGDVVLDAGTGPGYIANAVAPIAKAVIGLDISAEMMALANGNARPNQTFVDGDIRAIPFPREYFHKVYARMVIHGLATKGDADKAVRECYRVLRADGVFVFSEGTPPNRNAQGWYSDVFKLKEERLTMTIPKMRAMMKRVGFKNIKARSYTIKGSSVANWLDNSALAPEKRTQIMKAYRGMPDYVRHAYKATETEDDVLIDIKFAILVGEK